MPNRIATLFAMSNAVEFVYTVISTGGLFRWGGSRWSLWGGFPCVPRRRCPRCQTLLYLTCPVLTCTSIMPESTGPTTMLPSADWVGSTRPSWNGCSTSMGWGRAVTCQQTFVGPLGNSDHSARLRVVTSREAASRCGILASTRCKSRMRISPRTQWRILAGWFSKKILPWVPYLC